MLAIGVVAAVLAGCAAEDPAEVRAAASATFDHLVSQAAEVDTAVLRTLERGEEVREACAEEGRSTSSWTATGTMSVQAADENAAQLRDGLVQTLPATRWSELPAALDGQVARADADGTVVTLTAQSPLLVIAVLTECLPD